MADPRADSSACQLQAVSGQAYQGGVIQNTLHVPRRQEPQQLQCLQPSGQNSCTEPWHRREGASLTTAVSNGQRISEDGVVLGGYKSC